MPNYPNYKVSSKGFIANRTTGKRLKGRPNEKGYLRVKIPNSKGIYREVTIHRLVALHFIENPQQKPIVNHKDSNILNNRSSNLEWVTHKENIAHCIEKERFTYNVQNLTHFGRNRTFSPAKVSKIRRLRNKGWSFVKIARKFGSIPSTVRYVYYKY